MNEVLGMPMSLPVEKALRKAQSHIKAGELAEAEELYKQVLSKFPKNKKPFKDIKNWRREWLQKAHQTPSHRKNRLMN